MDGYINNKSAAGPRPGIGDIVGTEPATLPTEEFRVTGGGGAVDRAFDTHPAVADSGRRSRPASRRRRGREAGTRSLDMREAMFNDGVTGAASRIQLPTERITRLRGLMIDVDPGKLIPDNPLFPPAEDPGEFFGRNPGRPRSSSAGAPRGGPQHRDGAAPAPLVRARRRAGGRRRAAALGRPDPPDPGDAALRPQCARDHGPDPAGGIDQLQEWGPRRELRPRSPIDPQRVVEFAAQVKAAPFRVVAGSSLAASA